MTIRPIHDRDGIKIYNGDCIDVLRQFDSQSIDCCVTSPPYWGLRDYGHEGQIGLELTPSEYVDRLVSVFAEVCLGLGRQCVGTELNHDYCKLAIDRFVQPVLFPATRP